MIGLVLKKIIYFLIMVIGFNVYGSTKNEYNIGIVVHRYNHIKISNGKRQVLKLYDSLEKNDNLNTNIFFYKNTKKAFKDFYENKKIDRLFLWSLDYLENKEKLHSSSKKVVLLKHENEDYLKYNIIVRKNSNLKSVADLKNKKMSTYIASDNARLWFDSLILKKYKKTYDKFVKEDNILEKKGISILDVYFKKADFCIVSDKVYEDILHLNPSLANELQIIKQSPALFIYALVVTHKNSHEKGILMDKLIGETKKSDDVLHKTLKATLGIDEYKIVDFDYMEKVDSFYDEYLKLKSRYE